MPFRLVLVLLVACQLPAPQAFAQSLLLTPQPEVSPGAPPPGGGTLNLQPAFFPSLPQDDASLRGGCRFDVVAGLPIGVRLQVPFAEGERVRLLAEGTLGLYVVLPTVGAGVRAEVDVVTARCNRLTLSPGLGV